MNRTRTFLLAVAFAALAIVFVGNGSRIALGATLRQPAADSPNDTITLTEPGANTTIDETDDYATQVLGDPWDMTTSPAGDLRNLNGLDDIDQTYNYTPATVSNGIWSATTAQYIANGRPSFDLQYQDFTTAYSSLGEKNGQNYPVDAARFSRLLIRMNSSQAFSAVLNWFSGYNPAPVGNSNIFNIEAGWHIYSIDMRATGSGGSGNWATAGPYTRLMFQDISGPYGNNIQVDWARFTPDTGPTVRVAWSFTGAGTNQVHLYLSTSSDASSDNELEIGAVAASQGAFSWNTTGVAPGSYYIHAAMNGAVSSTGPLVVGTAPIARIDAPSPLSGEDFAYAHATHGPWTSANSQQFERIVQIVNLVFGAVELRGSPSGGDPQLMWLNGDTSNPIDASRYRYFSQRMEIDPPTNRQFAPYNAGPRVLWDNGSHTYGDTLFVYWPYRRYQESYLDLPNAPLAGGPPWSGQIISFRMDPLEVDQAYGLPALLPASFGITNAHLTSMPIAGMAGTPGSGLYGTVIRWTAMQGSGTVSLYRDNDNSGYNGTAIATNVPISQGYYDWDTSGVPAGTYYVYEIANDSTRSSRSYSLVPLVVDQSQPSTIFTDVPNNYWAVGYINRLALRNIVGGAFQEDTTVNFNPATTASRAQLSKIVVLAAGWTLVNPSSATFEDVPVGSTFFSYVETAYSHSVISGYPCGGHNEPCDPQSRPYFRPNRNVTRAQTAKMVSISRGWTIITPATPTFEDMPYDGTPGSLYSYVETAAAKGIITGYPCGGANEPCDPQHRPYYRPGNNVTRAQLSKMISTALDVP